MPLPLEFREAPLQKLWSDGFGGKPVPVELSSRQIRLWECVHGSEVVGHCVGNLASGEIMVARISSTGSTQGLAGKGERTSSIEKSPSPHPINGQRALFFTDFHRELAAPSLLQTLVLRSKSRQLCLYVFGHSVVSGSGYRRRTQEAGDAADAAIGSQVKAE